MGWQSRCPPRPWPPLWRSHPSPVVTVHLGAGQIANLQRRGRGEVRQNCHAGGCVKRQVCDPPSGLDLILGELDGLKFGPIHHDALAEQPSTVHRQMASVGGGPHATVPRTRPKPRPGDASSKGRQTGDPSEVPGGNQGKRRPQQASFQPPHPKGVGHGTQRDQAALGPRGKHQALQTLGWVDHPPQGWSISALRLLGLRLQLTPDARATCRIQIACESRCSPTSSTAPCAREPACFGGSANLG